MCSQRVQKFVYSSKLYEIKLNFTSQFINFLDGKIIQYKWPINKLIPITSIKNYILKGLNKNTPKAVNRHMQEVTIVKNLLQMKPPAL